MTRNTAWALLLSLGFVAACGGDDDAVGADGGGLADSGGGDGGADAGGDADAGDETDAGDGPDAGGDGDAGDGTDAGVTPGMVAWSMDLENPYVHTLDSEIALDYFLQYTVTLPSPNEPPAMLRLILCEQEAGTTEPVCTTTDSEATEGGGGLRYGLDPTNYAEGLNLYTFTLQLWQGGVMQSDAILEWQITYAPM